MFYHHLLTRFLLIFFLHMVSSIENHFLDSSIATHLVFASSIERTTSLSLKSQKLISFKYLSFLVATFPKISLVHNFRSYLRALTSLLEYDCKSHSHHNAPSIFYKVFKSLHFKPHILKSERRLVPPHLTIVKNNIRVT